MKSGRNRLGTLSSSHLAERPLVSNGFSQGVKHDAKGNITMYKACLVSKDYSQQFEFDFEDNML